MYTHLGNRIYEGQNEFTTWKYLATEEKRNEFQDCEKTRRLYFERRKNSMQFFRNNILYIDDFQIYSHGADEHIKSMDYSFYFCIFMINGFHSLRKTRIENSRCRVTWKKTSFTSFQFYGSDFLTASKIKCYTCYKRMRVHSMKIISPVKLNVHQIGILVT